VGEYGIKPEITKMQTLNHNKFLELVHMLEGQKERLPELEPLIALLKEMGQLFGDYDQVTGEDKEVVWGCLIACQARVQDTFAALCSGWGFTKEELTAYLNNPKNYTPDEWRDVQTAKQEAESIVETAPATAPRPRKTRKWA